MTFLAEMTAIHNMLQLLYKEREKSNTNKNVAIFTDFDMYTLYTFRLPTQSGIMGNDIAEFA